MQSNNEAQEAAAAAIGRSLVSVEATSPNDLDRSFQILTRAQVDLLIVLSDPVFAREGRRIAVLAAAKRLPTMYSFREYVEADGIHQPSRPPAHAFGRSSATPLLACYHRNVTHASLQTLSLGEFVSWVAAQHDAQTHIAPAVNERAKRAATLLELFSEGKTGTGKKVTYRTASVAAQIKDADWAKAVSFVKSLP